MIDRVYGWDGGFWRVVTRWGKPTGWYTARCSRCGWFQRARQDVPYWDEPPLLHRCLGGRHRPWDAESGPGLRNVLLERVLPCDDQPPPAPLAECLWRCCDGRWWRRAGEPRVVRPFRGLRRVP